MPGASQHRAIAVAAAAVIGLIRAQDMPEEERLPYVAGACLGALATATLPDLLEPAIHGWHRDVFHSGTAGVALVGGAVRLAATKGQQMVSEAKQLRETAGTLAPTDPRQANITNRCQTGAFQRGLVLGGVVGVGSHLVADAATPRGIPLLSRGLG